MRSRVISDVDDVAGGDAAGDDVGGERALVIRARSDRAAFAQLYRRHVDAVYGFAFRRCGSREVAEEATAATFERALRSIDRFEWRGVGVRPWLLRIVSNEVAELYRDRTRVARVRGRLEAGYLDGVRPSIAAGDGEDEIDLSELHAALDRIPERYRAAISLRYLAGLTPGDAAAAMGCTAPVLAVTLHRALRALRAEMTGRRPERGAR